MIITFFIAIAIIMFMDRNGKYDGSSTAWEDRNK